MQSVDYRKRAGEHAKRIAQHRVLLAIQTPEGRFESASAAAKHFKITRTSANRRAKQNLKGWSYA